MLFLLKMPCNCGEEAGVNPNIPYANTDWYKEVMHSAAPMQNHALNIAGGTENAAILSRRKLF
jgi:hypothetical protein